MRFLFTILFLAIPISASAQTRFGFQELLSRSLSTLELDGPDDKWSSRARLSALIPKIVLDGGTKNDDAMGSHEKSNFFRDEKGDLLHEWTQAQTDNDYDTQYELSIRLEWNFRQLIFHSDELASEGRALNRRRQKLLFIEKLSSSFARWQILERKRRHGDATDEETGVALGFEHYFDALTQGWFSRQRKSKK